jgi:hypothetical protein
MKAFIAKTFAFAQGITLVLLLSHSAVAGSGTREGTTVILSPSEIADLKQWVDNAKQDLLLLQDDVRRGSLEKRRHDIVREFEVIVGRSSPKENELLMRYTLNRALEIDELVGSNPAPSELQSLVAFLDSSIDLSKSFYTDDQKYLEAIGRGEAPQLQTPMALFAYQYAETLLQFSRTFLRPSLEYQITFKALGWLANDLNSPRNLLRIQFSESITRIARLQAKFPQMPVGSDQSVLQSIRDFKWEYRERVLKHISSLNFEIKDALVRAEKKRQEDDRLARLNEEERKRELSRTEAEKQQALENRKMLEDFKRGVLSSRDKFAQLLYMNDRSEQVYGRVFRSSSTGRIMEFSVKKGKLGVRYRHMAGEMYSKEVELIDGDFLLTMNEGSRWSIHATRDPDCILFDFRSGKDTLCSSAKLAIDSKVDQRGIYLSKKTSRYFIIESVNNEIQVTYIHGAKYGPAKTNFQSPNQMKLSVDSNRSEYLLQWMDENCIHFSWGYDSEDTLCRSVGQNIVPYGIYKSNSGRELIFRPTDAGGLTLDYNASPGKKHVIQENGVGYVSDYIWGYAVDSDRCVTMYWGDAEKDRLCKEERK